MKKIIMVDGMSCEHCVKRVTESINEIEGAKCLNVSLADKSVEIEYKDNLILSKIRGSIIDAGYEVMSDE